MQIESKYYNYYNVKGRYTPDTPQTPAWRKAYEVVDDRIESNNLSQDSETYKAYVKLEEIYYSASVSNRKRYSSVSELKQALSQKYLFNDKYKCYDYSQRCAMYENELNMTMFGTCGNMSDPRLGGSVKAETDAEQAAYNRQMVNTQINNILSRGGINISLLDDMSFSFDSYSHYLTVLGVENAELALSIERLLNDGTNSTELFHHIMQSNYSRIDKDVKMKYQAIQSFKEITGEDLRSFCETDKDLLDCQGRSALEVFKNALKATNKVPSEFKGAAYELFAGKISVLSAKSFSSISEMNLLIGFSQGKLQDSVFNPNIVQSLNMYV